MAKKTKEGNTYGFKEAHARNKAMLDDLERLLVRRFHYIGIESQGHARNNAGYTDRTGNLKNSIGYHLVYNGQEFSKGSVATDEPVPSPNGEGSLSEAGNSADKALTDYDKFVKPNAVAVVIVAGMRYASAVEAKGYNVLNATWVEAQRNTRADVADIIKAIKKKYGG